MAAAFAGVGKASGAEVEATVKTFKCGACGNTVYFENVQCLTCGQLARLPVRAARDGDAWRP